jgi:hypothetical protein
MFPFAAIRPAAGKRYKWLYGVMRFLLTQVNARLSRASRPPASHAFLSRRLNQPETTSFVESINNKVRVIKRLCYGIYVLKNLFQRLFLNLHEPSIFLPEHMVMI